MFLQTRSRSLQAVCGGLNSLCANRRTQYLRVIVVCGIRFEVCGIRFKGWAPKVINFSSKMRLWSSKMEPGTSKMRPGHGDPSGRRGGFWARDVHATSIFWDHLGVILRSFWHQFWMFFSTLVPEAFWEFFGLILEPC